MADVRFGKSTKRVRHGPGSRTVRSWCRQLKSSGIGHHVSSHETPPWLASRRLTIVRPRVCFQLEVRIVEICRSQNTISTDTRNHRERPTRRRRLADRSLQADRTTAMAGIETLASQGRQSPDLDLTKCLISRSFETQRQVQKAAPKSGTRQAAVCLEAGAQA